MRRERVAVVGSGIAGLSAAYVLQRDYDVTLYETSDRLGGHSHTHDVITPDSGTVPIDTGFIVHNPRTYPLLCKLFSELGIATQPTEMSMSVHCDGCGLEYAGAKGLRGVFSHPASLRNFDFLRLLAQVPRFYRHARRLIEDGNDDESLGDFLASRGFSDFFTTHFVVPIVSCVWSVAPGSALEYPARYLFVFLENHGMLSVGGSPEWRTVVGGSRTYVEVIAKSLTAVSTSTPVRSVSASPSGLTVTTDDDDGVAFDRAVIATHADTALGLLSDPSDSQRAILGAFQYSPNEVTLHTDVALLARREQSRAAWNYSLRSCAGSGESAVVSYDMNRLQGVVSHQTHVVTLNARDHVSDGEVIAQMHYEHPIYTGTALRAQARLSELNGPTLAFAGAYHGWGFHEDGCRSGVAAARALGVEW